MTVHFGPTTNLPVEDTAQLGLNVATATAVTEVLGPVDVFNGSATVTLTQVATVSPIGALPFDTTHVVTLTGYVDHHAPAAQFSTYAFLSNGPTSSLPSPASSVQIARNPSTSSPDAGGSFAIEQTYSCPAGSAPTYYLYGNAGNLSVSGAYAKLYNIQMKLEILKR